LSDHTSVHEQTSCATKLIKEFVNKLKQLGRYDDSLIIIQSDHGLEKIGTEPMFKIPQLKAGHYDENFSLRLHSLLLIKPPASGTAPLRISEEVSQLVDIPATVYDILDLAQPPNDGHSVFALDEVSDREISVFSGPRFNFGRAFGTLFKSSHTTLGHLGYNPARGWTTRPDIEATHEGWW
jgi:arylsulfatase A-like enzyme